MDAYENILHLPSASSTNDVAMQCAREGKPELFTVIADEQTAGRGRLGRQWASPAGCGMYASTILRPESPDGITLIPIIAGVAAAEAIAEVAQCKPLLKWPNDVLLNGGKIGGVIAEASMPQDGRPPVVIAGLGVNVNTPASKLPTRAIFPATSILVETGRATVIMNLLGAWIRAMGRNMGILRSPDGACEIQSKWNALNALRGKRCAISTGRGTVRGTAIGIASDGSLLLADDNGRPMPPLLAGDVTAG